MCKASKKIDVGKRKGSHKQAQEQINNVLIEHALLEKTVVRLKGGDPFIFGRGGEEIQCLIDQGIDVEVVPGISAGVAAGALAGIALTKRGVAASVAFCTGHPIDKIQVPTADTLVYYMGATSLKCILEKIIDSGRSENVPLAVVKNVSMSGQKVFLSTIKKET